MTRAVNESDLYRLSREDLVRQVVQFQERVSELQEKMELQQITDSLTGLSNRDYFYAALSGLWRRAKRFEQRVCLILVDVDNFRAINDQFGHLGGDLVLSTLADALRSIVRGYDLLARFGDEEFAVAIDNATIDLSTQLAGRIQQAVVQTPFCVSERAVPVTVTVGMALGSPSDEHDRVERLVSTAIQAVNIARQKGRNQTHILEMSS
jgi:diguanylate cyclase (GGDEF)-like protein